MWFVIVRTQFSSSPKNIGFFFSCSLCAYISRVFTALMSSQALFTVDCICCLLGGGTWIEDNSLCIDGRPLGVWVSSTGKDRLIFSDFPPVLHSSIISLYMYIAFSIRPRKINCMFPLTDLPYFKPPILNFFLHLNPLSQGCRMFKYKKNWNISINSTEGE